MKLEGVDPEHQSIYCVLTVAEVSRQPQCGVIAETMNETAAAENPHSYLTGRQKLYVGRWFLN